MSPHRKKHQTHFRLFIFLFFTARYCRISVRKNVLRKLLRIPYRRLKAGISVCWLCLFVAVCKSVFLLQIKYIGKFKLLWQLKIWVGGEVKLYYYAMKGSMGGGGGPSKIVFKRSWKKSKTKIKSPQETWRWVFVVLTFIIMIQTIFQNTFRHPPSPLPPNKSSLSQPKFNGKLSHWGGTGSH